MKKLILVLALFLCSCVKTEIKYGTAVVKEVRIVGDACKVQANYFDQTLTFASPEAGTKFSNAAFQACSLLKSNDIIPIMIVVRNEETKYYWQYTTWDDLRSQ